MQKLGQKLAQAEENIKAGTAGVPLSDTSHTVSSTILPGQTNVLPSGQTTLLPGRTTLESRSSATTSSTALPTTVIQDPAVVKETIRERELEEVQPILHREVEQPIIKKVTAPMSETRNIAEEQIYVRAAPEFREISAGGLLPEQQALLAQRELPESQRFVTRENVVLPTKVQEVVKEKIIEEVQPVIYREVNVPRTIHVEKDIYEKQVLPPRVVHEVRPMGTFTAPLASQNAQFTSSTTAAYTTNIPPGQTQ